MFLANIIISQQESQNNNNKYQQMSIFCKNDGSCPFLYQCNIKTNQCSHLPVFPLQAYPLIIYLLFPICSAICNLSGNSFGQWKVLMIMDLLNYSENAATTLAYPLITGTGLINFFLLIPKRHPTRNTSLVDFNVILILIPNVLFGSTIGALVNNFIPPIAADICIIPIFIGFVVKFVLRFRSFRQQELQQNKIQHQQLVEKQDRTQSSKEKQSIMQQNKIVHSSTMPLNFTTTKRIEIQKKQVQIVPLDISSSRNPNIEEQQKLFNPFQQQLDKKMAYQSGWHFPHIIATLGVFVAFQFLSFVAQGKIRAIADFSQCSIYYITGISCLTIIYLIYIVSMYHYTVHQMRRFRRIKYDYDGNLDSVRQYTILCAAGAIGGFNGGVFGLGSSTTMIFALLFLNIQPSVVSATVGFQVFFSGAASLAEAFARNQIAYDTAGFFFGQTFILGGILTLIARYQIQKLNILKVNQILVLIVAALCSVSIVALVINIVIGFIEFGSNYMTSIKFDC